MNRQIAEKIEKLFALAAGTSFPEEASSAIAKAQALMSEYKVTQAMLEDPATDEKVEHFRDDPINEDASEKSSTWKWELVYVLSQANGVFVYCRGPKFIATGKPSNVSALRYMYDYCYREIDRLTLSHCRGHGRTYANNFRRGCVAAISKAIKAEREETENRMKVRAAASNNSRDLIVLGSAIAKVNNERREAEHFVRGTVRLSRGGVSHSRGDTGGYNAGIAAGGGIYRGGNRTGIAGGQKKISH